LLAYLLKKGVSVVACTHSWRIGPVENTKAEDVLVTVIGLSNECQNRNQTHHIEDEKRIKEAYKFEP
jgi:hypothetical protein